MKQFPSHTARRWSGSRSGPARNLQLEDGKTDKDRMSSPNWASVFGITEDDLADLENHIAGQDHPLRWLLMNGHIDSSAYTRWARDEYGLPSVKDSYFEIPVDLVYWEAVKHQFKWTPSFFPLAEWQGVMLIGCLQPPDFHFPIHTPHRFVIASAHALEHRFRALEPQAIPHAATPAPTVQTPDAQAPQASAVQAPTPVAAQAAPAPAPTPVAPAPAEDLPPSHAPSEPVQDNVVEFAASEAVAQVRQRPADEVLADSLPQAPEVDMRDPDGLLVDVDSNSHIHLFAVPEGMSVEDLGKPVPTTPDGFDEVSRVAEISDFSEPAIEVPSPVQAKAAAAPQPAQAAPPQPAQAAAPQPAAEAPQRAPIVPPGPPPGAVKAAAEKIVMPPAPPPPPTPSAVRSNVSSTEPAVPLATCTTIDSLMAATVAHITVHFEHAMVLNYDNAVLKPVKWSELLLSTKGDNPDAISLEQASIFRIAARTSLPYHGYVVSNPTNAAFFNAFNRGAVPKHVTVMPVMIAGQLTAMLMGLTNAKIDYKGSLDAMEKLASDFSTQLERLREKHQAAA